ncbi:hypothetical protein CGRA01v4_09643 [Colletotrichum graminicola]|nr:hypothetical protein CGRA01v4_09643 [Colletotrichum graminicola]
MTSVQLDTLFRHVSFKAPSALSRHRRTTKWLKPVVPCRSGADAQSTSRPLKPRSVLFVSRIVERTKSGSLSKPGRGGQLKLRPRAPVKLQGRSHSIRYIREVTQSHGLSLCVRTDGHWDWIAWAEEGGGGVHSLHCI